MIECRGLVRTFGERRVVDGLDFDVARGETLVLIGASGSGKTTTLKMLNRLIEPSAGTIRIDGFDTAEAVPHVLRRQIGYGAQRTGLFPHMDVAQNVSITARLLGWSRDRCEARVDALLERVRLAPADYRHRAVSELSGGEAQRVSLARALMAEPRVLLLDEPFGALDPVTRDELQQALVDLRSALDLTIVFVTHDMSEALLIGDRIAFLEEGRFLRMGTPAALLGGRETDRVSDFLRAPRRQAARIEALEAEARLGPSGPTDLERGPAS